MTKNKANYTIQLEPEFVEEIDRLADKLGMSRGQLMRNCLISGYEDAKMLDEIGLLQAINYSHKLREFKESVYKGKVTIQEKKEKK